MDHDKQITDLVKKSKKEFLTDDYINQLDAAKIYDLNSEFEKTKKNRNFMFLVFLGAFVGFFILMSYGVSQYSNYVMNNVKVDLSTFDDVDNREFILLAGRVKNNYLQAQKEVDFVKRVYESKIETVETAFNGNNKIIWTLFPGKDQTTDRERRLYTETQNRLVQIDEIEKKYLPMIKTAEEHLEKTKMEYSLIDQNRLTRLQTAMNYSSDLTDINQVEKQAIVDFYSLWVDELVSTNSALVLKLKAYQADLETALVKKYNPDFSSDPVNKKIDTAYALNSNEVVALTGIMDPLSWPDNFESSLRTYITDFNEIAKKLDTIPYSGSVSKAIKSLYNIFNETIAEFDTGLVYYESMADESTREYTNLLKKYKDLEANYKNYDKNITEAKTETNRVYGLLDQMAIRDLVDGYVVTVEGSNIFVYLKGSVVPSEKFNADVYRNSQKIGSIKLTRSGSVYLGDNYVADFKLNPQRMDTIIIK